MAYDSIITWIENKTGIEFTSYTDLDKFHEDYNTVRSNLPGTTKQIKTFKDRMDDYLTGDMTPETKPSYSGLRGSIETGKLEEIRGMELEEAQDELDKVNASEYHSSAFKSKVDAIVQGKLKPDISEALSTVREQISSATKSEDLESISTGDIKRDYGESARKQVAGLLAEARTKFKSEAESFIDTLTPQISSATTLGELNRLESRASEAPSLSSENILLGRIENRRGEL